jgi:hypothetical protein
MHRRCIDSRVVVPRSGLVEFPFGSRSRTQSQLWEQPIAEGVPADPGFRGELSEQLGILLAIAIGFEPNRGDRTLARVRRMGIKER